MFYSLLVVGACIYMLFVVLWVLVDYGLLCFFCAGYLVMVLICVIVVLFGWIFKVLF